MCKINNKERRLNIIKNIIILNGAARKNGDTARLIKSFKDGAESSGNKVQEFYLQNMNINGCIGCNRCMQMMNPDSPCIQKDDMQDIYKAFKDADVVVFASPIYFWTITGTLKTAVDRLYAVAASFSHYGFKKDSILLMTAGSYDYSEPVAWHHNFKKYMGWNNLGEVLGYDKVNEAFELGKSIK